MHLRYFIIVFLITIVGNVELRAQTFQIHGQVNIASGIVYTIPVEIDRVYFGDAFLKDSALISDGKFTIKMRLSKRRAVYGYNFLIKKDSANIFTGLSLLSANDSNNVLKLDATQDGIAPTIVGSENQNELNDQYNKFFKDYADELRRFYDSIEGPFVYLTDKEIKIRQLKIREGIARLTNKSDSLFVKYSENRSGSFVVLWKLIERLTDLGYKDYYQAIFDGLSEDVRASYTGQCFRTALSIAKSFVPGACFPVLNLEDSSKKVVQVNFQQLTNKYTLIDFCENRNSTCITSLFTNQCFYDNYKIRGFEIIKISLIESSAKNEQKMTVQIKKSNWKSYFGQKERLMSVTNIQSFPTNFLLNAEGRIIKRDISKEELEEILQTL